MLTRDLAQRRMYAQRLWNSKLRTAEDVVGWLGAVQAQELPVARWSVGQRCATASAGAVDKVLGSGRILRTHVLRPTWHFVLPADIRWMLRLTGPRVAARMAPYDRRLELTEKVYSRANAVIARAVTGRHLTRAEIGDALERAKIPARGQRLGHIVLRAEIDGVVCSGVPRGKSQTYASLDERAPAGREYEADEAIVMLATRYFTSHGPATLKDFVWWSGLTLAMIRPVLPALEESLENETVAGRTYWFSPKLASVSEQAGVFDLVQVYDEISIAYSESRDVIDGARPLPRVQLGGLSHSILLDGRYAGGWKTSARSGWADVDVSTRRSPEELRSAIARYRAFMS